MCGGGRQPRGGDSRRLPDGGAGRDEGNLRISSEPLFTLCSLQHSAATVEIMVEISAG